MTPDPLPSAAFDFTLQVERLYAALMRSATASSGGEPSLGGQLLYAGELLCEGRATLVAANIAGAASLAATADPIAQKQAIRDGVADFLVTSLDEALRILKNEIRKRETVAVCVALAPQAIERAMLERGVLPDLLPPAALDATASNHAVVRWRVASAPALWLPKLDVIAVDCLKEYADSNAAAARRWLRLAPRYLGRLGQGLRLLRCDPAVAKVFIARADDAVKKGEIAVEVEIALSSSGGVFCFHPPTSSVPHP